MAQPSGEVEEFSLIIQTQVCSNISIKMFELVRMLLNTLLIEASHLCNLILVSTDYS